MIDETFPTLEELITRQPRSDFGRIVRSLFEAGAGLSPDEDGPDAVATILRDLRTVALGRVPGTSDADLETAALLISSLNPEPKD